MLMNCDRKKNQMTFDTLSMQVRSYEKNMSNLIWLEFHLEQLFVCHTNDFTCILFFATLWNYSCLEFSPLYTVRQKRLHEKLFSGSWISSFSMPTLYFCTNNSIYPKINLRFLEYIHTKGILNSWSYGFSVRSVFSALCGKRAFLMIF